MDTWALLHSAWSGAAGRRGLESSEAQSRTCLVLRLGRLKQLGLFTCYMLSPHDLSNVAALRELDFILISSGCPRSLSREREWQIKVLLSFVQSLRNQGMLFPLHSLYWGCYKDLCSFKERGNGLHLLVESRWGQKCYWAFLYSAINCFFFFFFWTSPLLSLSQ